MKCMRTITSADYELFINCGGSQMTYGGNVYQEDNEDKGPSYYKASEEKWAISSTGYFLNGEDVQ